MHGHFLKSVFLVFMFCVAVPLSAATINTDAIFQSNSQQTEIYVSRDGLVVISGAKVMQLAGRSFYTRLYWGNSFVRLLVKSTPSTSVLRGTGEATTYEEIKVGDYLNMQGTLESGAEALVLVPTLIRNISVQKEHVAFSGKVVSVNVSGNSFTLSTGNQGQITVSVDGNTVFSKGSRTIDLSRLLIGDTTTSISGVFDHNTKTLAASRVHIYLDQNLYRYQNFQGALIGTPGPSPSSIQIRVGGVQVTVNIPSDIIIWNKDKKPAMFARFVDGDIIRFHGKRQEADAPIIDADIVRNMNL